MGRESIRIACRYIANIQRELGHGVRPGVLAAALHGSNRRSVTEQGLELIDGHGAFSARSRPAVRNMIGTLEAIQAIDTGTGLVEPGPLFDIYLGGDRSAAGPSPSARRNCARSGNGKASSNRPSHGSPASI